MRRPSTLSPVPESNDLSAAVVDAIGEALDRKPTELRTRLYDVIDPDSLDRIFAPKADGTSRGDGRVEFTMAGCEVVVRSDRTVEVTPNADAGASARASATED